MKPIARNGMTLLALATIMGFAVAGTARSPGRLLDDPSGGYSNLNPPAPAASSAVPSHTVQTSQGSLLVPDNQAPAATVSTRRQPAGATVVTGADGSQMLVMANDAGANADANASKPPIGTTEVVRGGAHLWQVPTPPSAAAAPLPRGVRIVDLPPGAVAPVGMPEPMTLYRATPVTPAKEARGP